MSHPGRRLALIGALLLTGAAVWTAVPGDRGAAAGAGRAWRLPGAPAFSPALARRLAAALEARGAGYEPRTRHFRADGSPEYVNRLILERSPYLLQHAHNPVNWYPWGDEAFEVARRENKPVLLSVGYSTCHWCHVMERESFEDEEIAEVLNRSYVAVKVDRERRPDVDGVYMAAVQSMTGQGGWPMTVWLTPDRKPFYGGTYYPPRDGDRGARVGFLTLLRRLEDVYRRDPQRVSATAAEIVAHLGRRLVPEPSAVTPETLRASADRAFEGLGRTFDPRYGGFGGAPKFPRPVTLEFLLRFHHRTANAEALRMVTRTLDAMARGGIRDHVGGGFHRYSTDERWLVPHFEKMLYDNALLTVAYLEAYQATGAVRFAAVAREILRYVAREMTSAEGAFFSATDADSEGEEGRFFVWTPKEIEAVLGQERAARLAARYAVTAKGNFEGRNILHLPESEGAEGSPVPETPAEIREDLETLYRARALREPPLRDDKILASWNGLMISALAVAAHVLGEADYADRAARAADFVLGRMRDGGRLRRTFFEGHADGTAYLDDHAFVIQGLLDLHEATFETRWLREAIALQEVLEARFRDPETGGYFRTPDDGERLLSREKPDYDGAEPSGNSVTLRNLLRLEQLTLDERWRQSAGATLRAFGGSLQRAPGAMPKLLAAAEFRLLTPKEVILVKPDPATSAEPFLSRLRTTFLPNRVVAVAAEGEDLRRQAELVPLLENRVALRGAVTAYVCENRVCELPTTDPETFARQLSEQKAR